MAKKKKDTATAAPDNEEELNTTNEQVDESPADAEDLGEAVADGEASAEEAEDQASDEDESGTGGSTRGKLAWRNKEQANGPKGPEVKAAEKHPDKAKETNPVGEATQEESIDPYAAGSKIANPEVNNGLGEDAEAGKAALDEEYAKKHEKQNNKE